MRASLQVEQLENREMPAILFSVTTNNQLVTFDSNNPSVLLRVSPITGLSSSNETIMDLDVRPLTGGLYGRSSLDRLYLINPFGFAFPVGGPVSVDAVWRGFDFNPMNDRLRVTTNPGANLVFNTNFGNLINSFPTLTYQAGDVFAGQSARLTGVAFDNNFPATFSSSMYAIDHIRDTLVIFGGATPNQSQLITVGSLGRSTTARVGFDIAGFSNIALATIQNPGTTRSKLVQIDLTTGATTRLGFVGDGILLNDIAFDLRGTSGFTSSTSVQSFAAVESSEFRVVTEPKAEASSPRMALTADRLVELGPDNGMSFTLSTAVPAPIAESITAPSAPKIGDDLSDFAVSWSRTSGF